MKTKLAVLIMIVKEEDGSFTVIVTRYDSHHMEFTMKGYEHVSAESRRRLVDGIFALPPDDTRAWKAVDEKEKIYFFTTSKIGKLFFEHLQATRGSKKTRHLAAITSHNDTITFVRFDRKRTDFCARAYHPALPSLMRLARALNRQREDFDVLFTPELGWGAFNKLGEITLRGMP